MKINMQDDELLQEYAQNHSEAAFAQVVEQHIDLVYSTALRLVGEPHLAEDVAQMVFIALARSPRAVRNPAVLAGWLYRTARFTAGSMLRTEKRRRGWERTAMELNTLESDTRAVWEHLAPHLEAAMATLAHEDQDAVALRFFKGKSLREVGLALGASDDAAQKRITRALEKLRAYFVRRGITVSAGVIAAGLTAHAVQAAPAGLAASIAAHSLAATAGGGATVLGLKLFGTMTMANFKITAAALLVLAAVSTPLLLKRSPRAPAAQPVTAAPAEPTPTNSTAMALDTPAPPAASPARPSAAEQLLQAAAQTLSAEQIEAYLQQNHRSAENLLAAFRVSADRAYLLEAARAFPTNPAVQLAVITQGVLPEQQRAWLDAFKTSAPDNSLPCYFSAQDYLKAKQTDQAMQELGEATRRSRFQAYVTDASQAVEEMYAAAGRSPLEAKYASTCMELKPHLQTLKGLADELLQVRQQYGSQGDTASADGLAYMGWLMGDRLSTGANNAHVIDQLVGLAIQKKFLGQLDPAGTYEFLGRPVSEALAELDRQRQAIRDTNETIQKVIPTLNATELANYLERLKVYGEPAAWAWLKGRYSTAPGS
jgi:RNA polymerase sigma factor (sigma-70 family)